ncbi:MAG: T9SS type A sorting domain-containing protein [Paludibacter sp.]|nr:T9SS type A sorting domain-containing protein [Paludibacter sp.]
MARVGLIALQPGVYMVKVLLENGQTYTQKIVKN